MQNSPDIAEPHVCATCAHPVPFVGDTLPGRCAVHGITLCVESKADRCWWHDARNTSCERWASRRDGIGVALQPGPKEVSRSVPSLVGDKEG